MRKAWLGMALLWGAAAVYGGEKPEMWLPFRDEPTGVFPHEKDFRVFFANHPGVYYLRGSDPSLPKELAQIREAIREHRTVNAETEATYLYLRKVRK